MISGPIASGKSTVAAEVATRLRHDGYSVAVVGLDTMAEMALPTLPDWEWAHRIHAKVVGLWLRTGIDIVVDEGTSTPMEVEQVLSQVPEVDRAFHVVLLAEFAHSLARAQSDPARGVSKDPDFLRNEHERFASVSPSLPSHLQLSVEAATPGDLAEQILRRALI